MTNHVVVRFSQSTLSLEGTRGAALNLNDLKELDVGVYFYPNIDELAVTDRKRKPLTTTIQETIEETMEETKRRKAVERIERERVERERVERERVEGKKKPLASKDVVEVPLDPDMTVFVQNSDGSMLTTLSEEGYIQYQTKYSKIQNFVELKFFLYERGMHILRQSGLKDSMELYMMDTSKAFTMLKWGTVLQWGSKFNMDAVTTRVVKGYFFEQMQSQSPNVYFTIFGNPYHTGGGYYAMSYVQEETLFVEVPQLVRMIEYATIFLGGKRPVLTEHVMLAKNMYRVFQSQIYGGRNVKKTLQDSQMTSYQFAASDWMVINVPTIFKYHFLEIAFIPLSDDFSKHLPTFDQLKQTLEIVIAGLCLMQYDAMRYQCDVAEKMDAEHAGKSTEKICPIVWNTGKLGAGAFGWYVEHSLFVQIIAAFLVSNISNISTISKDQKDQKIHISFYDTNQEELDGANKLVTAFFKTKNATKKMKNCVAAMHRIILESKNVPASAQ